MEEDYSEIRSAVANLSAQLEETRSSLVEMIQNRTDTSSPLRPITAQSSRDSPAGPRLNIISTQPALNVNAAISKMFKKNAVRSPLQTSTTVRSLPKLDKPTPHKLLSDSFVREVILLRNAEIKKTLSKSERRKHREKDLIITGMKFQKSWTEIEVRNAIVEAFRGKIEPDFQFLVPDNSELINPVLCGIDFDGSEICRLYTKKTVYLRSTKNIDDSDDDEDDNFSSNFDDENSRDWFLPRNQRDKKSSTSMFSDVEIEIVRPRKKRNEPQDSEAFASTSRTSGRTLNPVKYSESSAAVDLTEQTSGMDYESIVSPANFAQRPRSSSTIINLCESSAALEQYKQCSQSPSDPINDHTYSSVDHQIDNDYRLALSLSLNDETEPNPLKASESAEMTPAQIIKSFTWQFSKPSEREKNKVIVSRLRPLESLEKYVFRKSFNIWRNFKVEFSGEPGSDTGGLLREFLDLVINHLGNNSQMFSGEGKAKLLVLNVGSLQKRHYFLGGIALMMTLIHGGPKPNFLHRKLYDLLVGKKDIRWDICDINEPNWSSAVTKLQRCSNVSEARKVLEEEQIFLDMKIDPFIMDMCEVDCIIDDCLKYFFEHRLASPLSQLKEGFSFAGDLFKAILAQPETFVDVFVGQDEKLTSDEFQKLFRIHRHEEELSPEYRLEQEILANWLWFLNDLEEQNETNGLTLEDQLKFIAGVRVQPVGGLEKHIDLKFAHKQTNVCPIASVCLLTLTLPVVHIDYDEFKKFMLRALRENVFGSV